MRVATPARIASRLKPHIAATSLILLLLAFIAAGAAYLFWRNYQETDADVRSRAASASQVVSANVQWAMETARQVLRRVDDSLGPEVTAAPPGAGEQLAEAISTLPGSVKVYVVDAQGSVLMSTVPGLQPVGIIDREYFTAVRDNAEWFISGMLVSRVTGAQVFVVSKRIERNGQFVGAAIMSFSSSLLEQIAQSLGLDALSTVGLARDDGQLVARYPLVDGGPQDLSKFPLFAEHLPVSPSDVYTSVSATDGIRRTVGYQRVPGTNLVAWSSINNEAAFAVLNKAMGDLLQLAIPAALALALVAYWTSRSLSREARRRESEAQFKILSEAMPNQVWTALPDGRFDWFNSRLYEYAGAGAPEFDARGWAALVHPDDAGRSQAAWDTALTQDTPLDMEVRLRRHDSVDRWHLVRAVPIRGATGKTIRWVGTNTDIDAQKEAQAHQEMLAHELGHRIKNILAMVSAIASQTLRNVDIDTARDLFNERLRALANGHDILTRTRWTEASLREVLETTVAPLPSERISISGPAVQLRPKMALSMALAVNELGTNALKYGALSNEAGRVEISWTLAPVESGGAPVLTWRWQESGGPAVVPPSRRGFGSFLVGRVLGSDFGGSVRIEYEPTGVVCVLTASFQESTV